MPRLFLLLFALSGMAGLTYEVVWIRQFGLLMGHAVAAVSTVLATYMAGLAGGAWLGGRLAASLSERRALLSYAGLEVVIAVTALAVPLALGLARPWLAAAYADGDGAWFGLARIGVSVAVMLLPTLAMGATFPLAVRWSVRTAERAGGVAGDLYGANTASAAIGAAMTAFVFIPSVGAQATLWIAAGLNFVAAFGAWAIARRRAGASHGATAAAGALATATVSARIRPAGPGGPAAHKGKKRATAVPPAPAEPGATVVAALVLALTGFVGLASEVAWTRVLALVIGPTTYAFGGMLVAFVAGIGLGALLAGRVVGRSNDPRLGLAMLMAALGATSAVALWRVAGLPLRVVEAIARAGTSPPGLFSSELAITATTLLPLAMCLGAAFPFAARLASGAVDRVARDVSVVYAANTVGAIAGSLCAGFVLLPRLGLQSTLVVAIAVACLGAAALALWPAPRAARGRAAAVALASVVVLGAAVAIPRWDPALLSSGAYKYAAYVGVPDVEAVLAAGTIEYYAEGAAGTVAVRHAAGARLLTIDGKIDASNASDMLTQKLLAHLPLLLHGRAERVAIIGMGSGVTLGAALSYPIAQADVVEISPEVVQAARFFAADNGRPWEDPRTSVIEGDGRTHLALSRARYDVVISEPSNPWVAGVAALFTREFFAEARARLAPGGILCQWAHTYDISAADLRSIAATFRDVFPAGSMWLVGAGDLLFIGAESPIEAAIGEIAARMRPARIAADLARVGVLDAESLLSLYVGGPAELRAFAAGASLQVDDRMALEYSVPQSVRARGGVDHAAALRAVAAGALLPHPVELARSTTNALSWTRRGGMALEAEAFEPAYAAFARALSLAPDDDVAAEGLSRAASATGRVEQAVVLLGAMAAAPDAPPAAVVAESRLLASIGQTERALSAVRGLIARRPDDPRGQEQLASIVADLGDAEGLAPIVRGLRARWPSRPSVARYGATEHLLAGRLAQALAEADAALSSGVKDLSLQAVRGVALASAGRRDEARRAFDASLEGDARNASIYLNLALLDLEDGRPDRAISRLGEVLTLDPTLPGALEALADALSRGGHAARAARVRAALR